MKLCKQCEKNKRDELKLCQECINYIYDINDTKYRSRLLAKHLGLKIKKYDDDLSSYPLIIYRNKKEISGVKSWKYAWVFLTGYHNLPK